MIDFEALQPNPSGGSDVVELDNNAAVAASIDHVNEFLGRNGADSYRAMADNANTDPASGTQYLLVGPQGYSADEVILMPGTFANGIKGFPHIAARADALAEMALQAGIRDSSGSPLPVLAIAAPSLHSQFGLDRAARRRTAHGDRSTIAGVHMNIMQGLGYGVLNGVMYSQAAAWVAPIAERAVVDMDVNKLVIGDYPLSRLGFMSEGKTFDAERKKDDIAVIEELFSTMQGNTFERGIVRSRRENMAIARLFGTLSLVNDLHLTALRSQQVTFVHATKSKVTPVDEATQQYEQAYALLQDSITEIQFGDHSDYAPDVRKLGLARLPVDSTHAFADRIGSSTAIFAANLMD